MSSLRTLLPCLLTLFALGCDNAASVGPTVPFARPEYLAFTCFAPRLDVPEKFELLPQACCSPKALELGPGVCTKQDTTGAPRLHALVTQSTRGEVAAVDISLPPDQRVLDSDTLIPGYTFLDSGGLPSAIVVPPHQQIPVNPEVGARFTFVASAEEYQVRAIPTCRFRSGDACGPELTRLEPLRDAYSERLKVPLPGAPGDMILGPDAALWVTLPELALIARIELANAVELPADAFARDEATGKPRAPQFFRVPEPGSAEPPQPVAERESYVEVCGNASAYVPQEVARPIAPRAPMRPIRPLRMRFERSDPSAPDGVLLVSDAAAPVLHAFTLGADGSLTSHGALPTGAPLRAFTLTAPVPEQVPRDASGAPMLGSTPSVPERRYMYAIDDRDGSLMVFDYAIEEGTARLTPLLAPVPGARFGDRIDVPAPAAALDVIDTRTVGSTACVPTSADPSYLRGVFVAVAAQSGILSLIDVLDLDLACRAQRDCDYAGGKPSELNTTGSSEAVTVRRHAARRSFANGLTAESSSVALLEPAACEDPSTVAVVTQGKGGAPLLCAPTDPWYQRADSWIVQFQAPLPGSPSSGGVLTAGDLGAAELVLDAPAGFDLCGRGVLTGDLVALFDPDERAVRATCSTLVGSEPANLLRVVQARRNQLIVQPTLGVPIPPDETDAARTVRIRRSRERASLLAECFPDFVSFDVRAKDFLVVGQGTGTYLHNVVTDEQGACAVDPQRPLITSRATPGERFRNPYISFQLRDDASTSTLATGGRTATVQYREGSGPLTANLMGSELPDVLPVTIRYQADKGELYIVDSASQGLERYFLQPFVRESTR